MKMIQHHWELDVRNLSVEVSMSVFAASWPEMYSLTDQIRRQLIDMENNPDLWFFK